MARLSLAEPDYRFGSSIKTRCPNRFGRAPSSTAVFRNTRRTADKVLACKRGDKGVRESPDRSARLAKLLLAYPPFTERQHVSPRPCNEHDHHPEYHHGRDRHDPRRRQDQRKAN